MYAESRHRTEVHNADDVDLAIAALSEADFSRLRTAARSWFRGFRLDTVAKDADDLIAEAVLRTASGRRSWKVGVGFVDHLDMIMRSIAESWRKSAARRAAAGGAEVRMSELAADGASAGEDGEAHGPLDAVPSPEPGVERTLAARERFRACEAHFADDEGASAVLHGAFYGVKGPRVQERSGMTKRQYEAARRRIRRYMDQQGGGHGE